jgi:hypothetical protein
MPLGLERLQRFQRLRRSAEPQNLFGQAPRRAKEAKISPGRKTKGGIDMNQ